MSRQRDPNTQDAVGLRQSQWHHELPDVDTRGMAILGRARWITLAVRPVIERVFADHGLDTGEFDVLTTLLRSGPPYRLRPTELYNSLMISSGGLTARLDRLEAADLIERPASTGDARSLPVQLTEQGKHRIEAAFKADMEAEAALLSALSETDQAELARLLAKLAASLQP